MLTVRLFGRFEVVREDRPIDASEWSTEKDKSLLKILLTDPGRSFSSEVVIEHLWPDGDPEKALSNLKGRVSQLRRVLEPDLAGAGHQGPNSSFIKTVPGGYRFNPAGCWIDTEAFQAAHDRANRLHDQERSEEAIELYRRAAELYRGDVLPQDNHLEPVVQRRRELRARYLGLIACLVNLLREWGHLEEGIRFCERGLTVDPHDEALYRALMTSHAELGNVGKALDVYQACRDELGTTLGIEPSPETQELCQELRAPVDKREAEPDDEARLSGLRQQLQADHDPATRVDHLIELSQHLAERGQPDEQLDTLREAVRLAEASRLFNPAGRAHCELAWLALTEGHGEQASASTQRALRCFDAAGNGLGYAQALTVCGQAEFRAGRPRSARAHFEQALRRLNAVTNAESAGGRLDALSGLGRVLSHQGRYGEALDALDEAYQLSIRNGLRERQPNLLLRLGALHYYMSRPAEAQLHWERGQELAHRLGDWATEGKCLNNLALCLMNDGDLEHALERYDRILAIAEDLEDNQLLADAWNNVGRIYDILGRIEDASGAYQRSLDHSERMDDNLGVAKEEINLAGLHIQRGQLDDAERLLKRAFPVLESAEASWWVAQALIRWGWLEQAREAHSDAVPHFERAAALGAEIGHKRLEIGANAYLALSRLALSEVEGAIDLAQRTSEALRHVPSGYYLIATHYRLFRVFEQTDYDALAKHHLETAHRLLTEFAERLTHTENAHAFFNTPLHRTIAQTYRRSNPDNPYRKDAFGS